VCATVGERTLLVNQPERATEFLNEALPIYRAHAEPIRLAAMLHTAGTVALVCTRLEEAQERFIEVPQSRFAGRLPG
jgi:hypothetical protein